MKKPLPAHCASPAIATTSADMRPRINAKRRKTFVGAALACAIPSLAFSVATPAGAPPSAKLEDANVDLAITFLKKRYFLKLPIVYSPVSLLQRQFRLGYAMATALAMELERIGFWQLHEPQPKQRIARLNASFSPDCEYLPG